MTVVMLEEYIRSEVENIHLCVDQIASMRQHLNDIAESTKRQVVLIWDDLETRIEALFKKFLRAT